MLRNSLLSLGALFLFAAATTAQCGYNAFPIRLVDAQGDPRPITFEGPFGSAYANFPNEAVYLAFDSNLPSGTYYVHVTDSIISEVLSANDPMDRFVTVTNTNGVITLSLPYTNNPNPAAFGVAQYANGLGHSLLLSPLRNAATNPCSFKAWFSDSWDVNFGSASPQIIREPAYRPGTTVCTISSFHHFRIGDGTGSDVAGNVFRDTDRDGVRDVGEPPLAGWEVRLVSGATAVATTTDSNGHYVFPNVTAANYTVELTLAPGYVATTTQQFAIEVCGCADLTVGDFGAAPSVLVHNGHTIGFWRNVHGLALVTSYNILATLPALYLRNASGAQVAPGTTQVWKSYLQGANSVNMAYMLSAQLAAMHCNVITGFVDGSAVIQNSHTGNITIYVLMQRAITSLMAHGYTPAGSPWRSEQEILKNALDDANNNRNWL